MTLERILRAAVNSMIGGKRSPHCYRAWVQGKGYVNDGSIVADRADYLRQLKQTADSEVENMGFAVGYAEPGYDNPAKGVLFANWNNLPRNLDRVLERAGYAIEWLDEWSVCDGCQKAVRTQPDGYGWQPSYTIEHGEIVCNDCKADDESFDESDIERGNE